jgi:hypothetical protein
MGLNLTLDQHINRTTFLPCFHKQGPTENRGCNTVLAGPAYRTSQGRVHTRTRVVILTPWS